MTINWETIIISVISSGVVSAIITSIWNEKTQIKAIKESGLYAKRVEVLDELIKKMENLNKSVNDLISPFPFIKGTKIDEEKSWKMLELLNEFVEFYRYHKHYLSKEISGELDQLINKHFDIYTDFIDKKIINGDKKDEVDKWMEINKKYFSELNSKKEKIINDFRMIIGSE